jgi:hypothetical protein
MEDTISVSAKRKNVLEELNERIGRREELLITVLGTRFNRSVGRIKGPCRMRSLRNPRKSRKRDLTAPVEK